MSAILDLALVLVVAAGILWLGFWMLGEVRWNISWYLGNQWYLMSVKNAAGKWAPLVSHVRHDSGTIHLDRFATKHMSVDEMREMATALQDRLHPDSVVQVSEVRWNIRIDFYQGDDGVPYVWVFLAVRDNPYPPRPETSATSTGLFKTTPFPLKS